MKKQIQFMCIKKYLLSILIFLSMSFIFFNTNYSFSEENFLIITNNIANAEYFTNNLQISSNNPFLEPVFALFRLIGFLIYVAVGLIKWTFDESLWKIISSDGVYIGWSVVRDFLNIFFIFFLLYSAFCTVFQISRYHIKSTWVMIVLMALLVNFSWPITRVMIDISNLGMLYILGDNGGKSIDNGILKTFSNESNFAGLMLGVQVEHNSLQNKGFWEKIPQYWGNVLHGGTSNDIKFKDGQYFLHLFMGIIIGFVFLITFLTIAILLIIRIIVLIVLLIFSPVGYAFAAFPSTRGYASQWWSSFTKQLITGPVLLFCLLLGAVVLQNIQMDKPASMQEDTLAFIAPFMMYIITIVLIWTGILFTQQIGAIGSGVATNFANKARGKIQGWGKAAAVSGMMMTARGTNQGTAWAGNKLSNLKGDGVWKKIGRGAGTSINVARSIPQRGKNIAQNRRDSYNEAIEESRARGLTVGTGLSEKLQVDNPDGTKARWYNRAMGSAVGGGGDKNAVAANKGKQIEAEKKRMKETPLNEATEIKAEAKAQSIIEKKDNVTEENIKELIKSLDKLDGDTRKLALKKARETGHGHLTMDHEMAELRKTNAGAPDFTIREMAAHKIFSGMDAKTLARQKVAQEYVKTPDNQNLRSGFAAMESKLSKLSDKSKADFRDALNSDQLKHLSDARKANENIETEAESMSALRDMNS